MNKNRIISVSLLSELVSSLFFRFHPLILAGFSALLFLPTMGHGFVHDDFLHLFSVAYHPTSRGLFGVNGGPFYAPLTWVSYKIDWLIWGYNPYAFAAVNLLFHIANTLLVYLLALRLWRSYVAARWAGWGFALLFPANVWAIMWIATRAHILVTFFCLCSLLAALWFARTERHKAFAAIATVLLASLAIFSKENGTTVPAAIAVVLLYDRLTSNRKNWSTAAVVGLFAALFAVVAAYLLLRANSGAVNITTGCNGYGYCLSLKVILDNIFRYGWRTFGLLALVAGAIAVSQYLRGARPRFELLTRNEVLMSLMLFGIALAPIIMVRLRSGIYSYLPGVGAALLLGAVARSLYGTSVKLPLRSELKAALPVVLVLIVYSVFTRGHSLKWIQMAETNTAVINQITAQQGEVKPKTLFVLTYSKIDNLNRFPDGMDWGFTYALRVRYADPSLNGLIVRQGDSYSEPDRSSKIFFTYDIKSDGKPQVVKNDDGTLLR